MVDTATTLQVRDLTVRFGPRVVLDHVSIDVYRGEVCGILGPNGAGKTTLLRAALGLVPYEGSVKLGSVEPGSVEPGSVEPGSVEPGSVEPGSVEPGSVEPGSVEPGSVEPGSVEPGSVELRELSALARAKQVAYVPQRSLLTAPLSVQEVVVQGRYAHEPGGKGFTVADKTVADKAAVAEALADCDLGGFESRRFTQLSGGEQRRVLLARALATGAPLILLDEPSAALDIPHALAFCDLVRRLAAAGRSVVVVLHNLDEASRMCDRVVLLRCGAVHGAGPTSEWISEAPVRDVFGVNLLRNAGFSYALPKENLEAPQ